MAYTVHDGARYHVESSAGGVFVVVKRKSDGADVGLQGDEAVDFLDELALAIDRRRGGGDALCADYDHVMRVHAEE